ncbi:MAG: hypothetical protein CM15mP62_33560 [Rhodospirillaceae bacterium]|nr:MAG: hypothetical protein CM15mP62_33560 [Rhodospirillaceae bacterium]
MENRIGRTGNQFIFTSKRILWNSNRIRAEVEFKMEIASGIVVYVLLWWWIFLMALPFGVSRQTDGAAGHDTGAPKKPLLATKVIITSLLALVFGQQPT